MRKSIYMATIKKFMRNHPSVFSMKINEPNNDRSGYVVICEFQKGKTKIKASWEGKSLKKALDNASYAITGFKGF
mgnify:CR=1 FL=1